MTPLVALRGEGDLVWDADGHSYIDYCQGWGSLLLGHAHPCVVAAATEQLKLGSSFGIATPYEEALAAQILKHMPSIEKIRFVSSGTEAVMSAVRLARGFTRKTLVVKFDGNYHGHFDSFLIRAGSGVTYLNASSSSGVPSEYTQFTVSLPYNEVETVRAYLRSHEEIAAVVVEPIAGNMGVVPATEAFIHMLREETKRLGALLIFDEVITGFRVGLQGAQGLYGITPDLTTLGKIIGGGFPAAAFGGKAEVMNCLAPLGQVYQAGTLSGSPVAMEAGRAALTEAEKPGFYEDLKEKTKTLLEPLYEMGIRINQVGSMFTIFVGDEAYKKLFVQLFERGIYFPPSQYEACFVSSAHTAAHLKYTQDALVECLR